MSVVYFKPGENYAEAEKMWKYDYGQTLQIHGLKLPRFVEVQFSSDEVRGVTTSRVGHTVDGVTTVSIADSVFEKNVDHDYRAFAFIYVSDDNSGRTEYKIGMMIQARPKPDVPRGSENDEDLFRKAILTVNAAAESAEKSANEAEQYMNYMRATRVESLSNTDLVCDPVIETVGVPQYISEGELVDYSAYDIREAGWYVFARIHAEDSVKVDKNFNVEGAAGYIKPIVNSDYVDIAVMFGVAAESQKVTVNWGSKSEIFVFKSTDLAVRNLDYRVTYYVYDIKDYTQVVYTLTTDTKFASTKTYYTLVDGEYVPAEVTANEEIPADTYYTKSLIIKGFAKNISYSYDEIDCPVTIYLPETNGDRYGTWFEIQTKFTASFSVTLIAPDGVRVSGSGVHTPNKGINIINFQFHQPSNTWLPTVTYWKDPTTT